ncbi:MAG: Gfo/Idh/MocA family oxidoreductase [Cyclobacteriaceae bacterium]|nr:Gfo/Idh/MocA family oxidoreductase [Cyclobacteriaceae bacterium]
MIKAGIIGCGKVAHLHAKALADLPNAKLIAVHSRMPEKAATFGRNYGAKGYSNITEMVKTETLDLVIICTPHPNHREVALQSLEAGAHVLVEKPLAASLEDCDSMINMAKIHGKKLGVISQRRFYEPVVRVKKAIADGKIGTPVLAVVNMFGWRDENYYKSDPWRGSWQHEGGGVLVNQAPHQLDVLLWMMGEIDELYGVWANLNHPYIEVEDTALAIIKFKNGALGNLVVSNSQKPGLYGKIHIHGSNGASVGVQPEGGSMFIAGMSNIAEPPINDIWTVPGEEGLLEKWQKEDSDFFSTIDATVYYIRKQIEDFVEAIVDDREPLVSGNDGRRTVELFTAIYRSQRDRKIIKFPLAPEADA